MDPTPGQIKAAVTGPPGRTPMALARPGWGTRLLVVAWAASVVYRIVTRVTDGTDVGGAAIAVAVAAGLAAGAVAGWRAARTTYLRRAFAGGRPAFVVVALAFGSLLALWFVRGGAPLATIGGYAAICGALATAALTVRAP